jgi:hypothetical protein
VPRVPLPDVGVTSIRETCPASSEDITPRSSLLRTHASIPCGSPLLRLLASFEKSSQVATSPCCYRDSPDVISANLSPDAWSPTPTVPPSALACFFLGVIGLPKTLFRSASRWYPRTRFFRGLVLEVADISLCSGLRFCSPPRSLLPLRIFPQGSRGFYIRAYRASLPPHAPDMLSVRIQAIDRKRTSTFLDLQPCRPLRVPHEPNRKLVSSPRHFKPIVPISSNGLTCSLLIKGYGTDSAVWSFGSDHGRRSR